MEKEIIPKIGTSIQKPVKAGDDPDEKEKDDGVRLPERDLVMQRPPAGQAPKPFEKTQ